MACWLKGFVKSDDGAITVDWVVLTGALIGMTLAIVIGIRTTATDPAESVGAALTDMDID